MNFLKSQRGGITVFQCIILMAMLALTGILVDAARIMVAEKKVQSALNTAARSALADYDAGLVGDYGIFGVDTKSSDSPLKDNFISYFKSNLNENHQDFHFINYIVDLEKTDIEGHRGLLSNAAEDNAFREQIIKYMKYRAPISSTKGVIDKVMASGIFKKKEFASKEKDVRKEREKVSGEAKELNKNVKDINNKTVEVQNYTVNGNNGNEYLNKVKNLKDTYFTTNGNLTRMETSVAAHNARAKDSRDFAEKVNSGQEGESYPSDIEIDAFGGDAAITEASENLEKVLKASQEAKEKVSRSSSQLESLISQIEPLQNEINEWNSRIGSLERDNSRLRGSISSLVDDKDVDHSSRIADLQEQISENNQKLSSLESQINTNVEHINSIKAKFALDSFSEIELEDESGKARDYTAEDEEKAEENKELLNKLKDKMNEYLKLKVIKDSWLINESELNKATEQSYEDYKTMKKEYGEDEAEEKNESIFAFLDRLKNALTNAGENVYVVEYIMDRFTYHTSTTEREHYFQKGEVEYLLWGNKSQDINITTTMTSIGFLRFAINSIDYFATSKVPHPVARLIYALARGLIQSSIDCYNLYTGKEIHICPSLTKTKVTLNYADHLRIFLLIQSSADNEGQLNSIRNLIQVNLKKPDDSSTLENPDFKLGDYNAMLQGKASVKVNLWFLPLLQLDKMKLKNFYGGSYRISKEVYTGY